MVAARVVFYTLLLVFCSSTLAGAIDETCGEAPCYYDEFNPEQVPWVAPPSRNFEEVFKHYRYYSIRYSDEGARLQVVEYVKGDAVATTRYRRDKIGALIAEPGLVSNRDASLYLRHCASCHGKDRLEPLYRFPTHYALHGGLKYSPDGRFVYLASRDGWISKFDLYNLKIVAEIRAGINTRNVAVSGERKTLLVGNYLPETLVLLNAEELSLIKVIPVRDDTGKTSAHVEFTRDGRYALVSLWEDDGALVVYDAATLDEVKRIPMRKPSGKYNVFNKITRSSGTSH